MASISNLVSEIAHTTGHPLSQEFKEHAKLLIIQIRNELIRRSYENHHYVDKGLTQRFRVELITVPDGDLTLLSGIDSDDIFKIKRTKNPVPKPVRLINNLPFDRVSTVGYKTNKVIPFVKETSARFTNVLPGFCGNSRYDYINGYIYIFPPDDKELEFNKIVIEGAFEHPNPIDVANGITTELEVLTDDNEYLLSEDMIGQIKEIIYKRDLYINQTNLLDKLNQTT